MGISAQDVFFLLKDPGVVYVSYVSHSIHGTGIFTYIYHELMPNVGKYTIHVP